MVYGVDIHHIPKDRYKQFLRLESSLHVNGIFPRDYAYGLSENLRGWVSRENWRCLPMNIFCGDWAVAHYVEDVGNRSFTPPTSKSQEDMQLVYDELLVAKAYISNEGNIAIPDIALMFADALSNEWMFLFRVDRRGKLIVRVLDYLSEQYGMFAMTYDDFVGQDS